MESKVLREGKCANNVEDEEGQVGKYCACLPLWPHKMRTKSQNNHLWAPPEDQMSSTPVTGCEEETMLRLGRGVQVESKMGWSRTCVAAWPWRSPLRSERSPPHIRSPRLGQQCQKEPTTCGCGKQPGFCLGEMEGCCSPLKGFLLKDHAQTYFLRDWIALSSGTDAAHLKVPRT